MHALRVNHYDSVMRYHPDISQRQEAHFKKCLELLYDGRTEQSIQGFDSLLKKMPLYQSVLGPSYEEKLQKIKSGLAIAYLRLGEQKNCILNHTSASCIIPIAVQGQHSWTHGSERAISQYREILNQWPDSYDALWLLNIASMTLGQYPNQIPFKWLIPPQSFQSDYPLVRFTDIAPQVGLDVMGLSGGSVIEDFNGDGLLDLFVTSWGISDQVRYFERDVTGTFEEKTLDAGLSGQVSGLNVVHADYDNDGWSDLLILRGAWLNEHGLHPNSLLRNLGPDASGTAQFEDVTQEAGILSFYPTQTATWNDFNLDGWLDLFIGNETNPYVESQNYPSELYLSNKDGTFREVASLAGIAVKAYTKGVTSGDFDNDGWPDLYLSTLEDPNFLFKNDGPGPEGIPSFRNVTEEAGINETISTFPTWFWDYDNDGWLDLFVAGYNRGGSQSIASQVAREYLQLPFKADMPRLYRNNRDGTFSDVTSNSGLYTILHAMGSNFGDLDNDGFLDFYVGTGDPDFRSIVPNRMFRNEGGKYFQDVTTAGGFGNLQKGHGVSFADLDQDGDQDIYIVMGGANYGDVYQNILFENPSDHGPNSRHWIKLELEGVETNRSGIGAKIIVHINESDLVRQIVRHVNTGGSFGGNPLRLELGLGHADRITKLEVEWPVSRQKQQFKSVPMNQYLKITEGNNDLEATDLIHVPFKPDPAVKGEHRHHEHQ